MSEFEARKASPTRVVSIVVLICGLFGLFLLPESTFAEAPNLCLHRKIFGFPCPGCGMTRALHAALHLQISKALEHHFAVLLLVLVFITEVALFLSMAPGLIPIRKFLGRSLFALLCFRYVLHLFHHMTT